MDGVRGVILGVGIDSVQVARMRRAAKRWGKSFLRRLFTEAELRYCLSHANPYPSLAARFAAKEALLKALGEPYRWKWHNMEVKRAESGKPSLKLRSKAADFARRRKAREFHVSLTHDSGRATAVVMAVRGK